MWDAVKATKPGEGTLAARNPYNCVAALRDLADALRSGGEEAQRVAGAPDPGDDDTGEVAVWAERFGATGIDLPIYTLPDLAPGE
ncbi:hypothetical protein [Nonomuraea insulae]|uniref:Uncharacterized protein n=1 Tax=Nonomuraea insulae TaxID=1616787 RepID=A0ABW1CY46_9ACTN